MFCLTTPFLDLLNSGKDESRDASNGLADRSKKRIGSSAIVCVPAGHSPGAAYRTLELEIGSGVDSDAERADTQRVKTFMSFINAAIASTKTPVDGLCSLRNLIIFADKIDAWWQVGSSSMKSCKTYRSNSILADPQPAAMARRSHSTIHGLLAALTLAGCLAHGAPTMATEEPRYEVLEREGDLEIRRYEPFIVAETLVDADFERAGNEGFKRLADYIFGNNRSRQKLEMTAPVSQARSEKIAMTAPVNLHRQGNLYRVTFMMPAEYTLATLPEPVNPDVRLRQVPAELVAALRYSGRWSQQRYDDHKAKLESWVAKRGWHPAGEPILARYDPPFKPWFLRRNEVLIPLSEGASP